MSLENHETRIQQLEATVAQMMQLNQQLVASSLSNQHSQATLFEFMLVLGKEINMAMRFIAETLPSNNAQRQIILDSVSRIKSKDDQTMAFIRAAISNPTSAIRPLKWRFFEAFAS
jgi:hypothetical protein